MHDHRKVAACHNLFEPKDKDRVQHVLREVVLLQQVELLQQPEFHSGTARMLLGSILGRLGVLRLCSLLGSSWGFLGHLKAFEPPVETRAHTVGEAGGRQKLYSNPVRSKSNRRRAQVSRGALLGRSGALLGRSWRLGVLLGALGALLEHSVALRERSWATLGALLGRSWHDMPKSMKRRGFLDPTWAPLV